MKKNIIVIGGGPAGLMAAEFASHSDVHVHVYEAMPSLGRKFLMAGKSGLNLTHAEAYDTFITRYGSQQKIINTFLQQFTPTDLIAWVKQLGIETFVGSSGRVFPKEMKASPLLRAWIHKLQARGVSFHLRHRWMGWQEDHLVFDSPQGIKILKSDATVLALGGASWPKLGSRGDWVDFLTAKGIAVKPFQPANCGFIVNWTDHFKEKFHGQPIKSVVISINNFKQQGEFVVTKTGVEGSLIYQASAILREEINRHGKALLTLDLMPNTSVEKIEAALSRPQGSHSLTNHIKKTLGLSGVKIGLLYEFFKKDDVKDFKKLALHIKSLPIPLIAPFPIENAISTAGGVCFDELNENLMLHKIPGVFCAGEMLDWEAPTGGYLLTACFATGKAAGQGAGNWYLSKVKN